MDSIQAEATNLALLNKILGGRTVVQSGGSEVQSFHALFTREI
jgi:hypothetical protein